MSLTQFFKKEKAKTALVFDIGTSSVGTFYADYTKELPHLLFQRRKVSYSEDTPSFEKFLSHILWSLTNVATGISDTKSFNHPEKIVCFLPSTVTHSQVRYVHVHTDEPTTITPEFIKEACEAELYHISEAYKKEHQQEEDVVFIEHEILNIFLNGYPVDNPYGKKSSKVVVALFVTYVNQMVTQKIATVLEKLFHRDDIVFRSGAVALFTTARDLLHEEEHFTYLRVLGEGTELMVVHRERLSELITFPYGALQLYRTISKELGIGVEEARNVMDFYKRGQASSFSREKIEGGLHKAEEMWRKLFFEALTKADLKNVLPSHFFISGDSTAASFFSRWLGNTKDMVIASQAADAFAVHMIEAEMFEKKAVYATPFTPNDPTLALFLLFTKTLV